VRNRFACGSPAAFSASGNGPPTWMLPIFHDGQSAAAYDEQLLDLVIEWDVLPFRRPVASTGRRADFSGASAADDDSRSPAIQANRVSWAMSESQIIEDNLTN
jgi:hypothetical protein